MVPPMTDIILRRTRMTRPQVLAKHGARIPSRNAGAHLPETSHAALGDADGHAQQYRRRLWTTIYTFFDSRGRLLPAGGHQNRATQLDE